MSVIYLTTMGSHVRRRGERLEVWRGNDRLGDIRLFNLERLVVIGSVGFSTPALGLLLDRGIDVSFLSARGRLRGSLLSGTSKNVFLRLAQFDRWRDLNFRIAFGRQVVKGKLRHQIHLLSRYERNHPNRLDPEARERLGERLNQVDEADSADSLMGIEGMAAKIYYQQFGVMLRTLPFPGRQRRPATDPANALLNLGYVMLGNEIGSALEARGFDPGIGLLHGLRYGRKSLALDVIEVFRQPIIDRFTLRLLNRRQFSEADFEGGEGGLRLEPEALKRYFRLYEEQLRSASEGEGSPNWRRQLSLQVERLQTMVMEGKAGELYDWKV